jgi:hypothetical protein
MCGTQRRPLWGGWLRGRLGALYANPGIIWFLPRLHIFFFIFQLGGSDGAALLATIKA